MASFASVHLNKKWGIIGSFIVAIMTAWFTWVWYRALKPDSNPFGSVSVDTTERDEVRQA